MKLSDNIINKFGNDKIIHFLCGALITSLILILGLIVEINILLSFIIGAISTFVLSILKELLDDKFDWKDVLATNVGIVLPVIVIGIGLLL